MSWTNHILVIRPDRIGDVVLSTPVLDALKAKVPGCKITVLVRAEVAPLLKTHPSVDHILIYDPKGRHQGWAGIQKLSTDLSLGCFGTALVLQGGWQIALAVMLAGIPQRIGPKSKLHSYFLYNEAIRQNRSRSDRNEADYNLELAAVCWLGSAPARGEFPAHLELDPADRDSARDWLRAKGWKEGEKLVVVHPGMGGSALNWPEANYVELVRRLLGDGVKVVLSFGPADGETRRKMDNEFGGRRIDPWIFGDGEKLAGIFSWASVVVAPSTGPLHIAAALGRPVVSFYPPIQVQSPKRWGPFVKNETQARVFSPEVACGQVFKCAGEKCPHFFCMDGLTVDRALEEVKRHL